MYFNLLELFAQVNFFTNISIFSALKFHLFLNYILQKLKNNYIF